MELSIEQFNPKEAELVTMANEYKNLTINGVNDSEGYLAVSTARKHLAKTRVQITKDGKLLREEAVKFQKDVIARERELIAIIEPVERELEEKEVAIDNEKLKVARAILLPDRRAKLAQFNLSITDDELNIMDAKQFDALVMQEMKKYLDEQAARVEREKAELEAKRLEVERMREMEEAKIRAAEQARIAAEERARQEAERAKNEASQKLIDAENRMKKALEDAERKRLADIQALKDAEEKKKQAEELEKSRLEAEQKKAESTKKYKAFLAKNGYVDDGTFSIITEGRTVKLFKLIDTITL